MTFWDLYLYSRLDVLREVSATILGGLSVILVLGIIFGVIVYNVEGINLWVKAKTAWIIGIIIFSLSLVVYTITPTFNQVMLFSGIEFVTTNDEIENTTGNILEYVNSELNKLTEANNE